MSKLLSKNWAEFTFTILLFLFVLLVLFCRAGGASLSHDEFQFVAGAQFFRTNGLLPYVDYPFLHMPYMPVIYGMILHLGEYDLLTARLFNEISILFCTFLLFLLTTNLFKNTNAIFRLVIGTLTVLFFITNSSLVSMDGRALNHGIPTLLSIGSVWMYWQASNHRLRGFKLFLCGLFIGIATGNRLNYLVLIVPFIFAILFDPFFNHQKEKLYSFIFFFTGFLAALLPAGILFLLAPKQFIYGNFHYIALNTIYRKNLGYPISMNFLDKLTFFYKQVLSDPENIILYFAWIGFTLVAVIRLIKTKDRNAFLIIFVSLFSMVLLTSAFSPTPLWPQYFFGPVPFMIIGLFLGIFAFFGNRWLIISLSLAVLLGIFVISRPLAKIFDEISQLTQQEQWTTIQMHQFGEKIRAQIVCPQDCKVLTLVPILPLEAGLDTYPMFAVGSFSWRTAPILSKERRAEYRIISADDLDDFLHNEPPVAILTGTEAHYDGFTKYDPGGLDQPFVDYAMKNNFRPVKILDAVDDQETFITLWIK